MSTKGPDPVLTPDETITAIRAQDDPFVTASDIADTAGVARQTAYRYLQQLHEDGRIHKRKIGGSAVIWWIDE